MSAKILFSAKDGAHGTELWVTDGTAAGTSMVADVYSNPTTAGSYPLYITPLGNGETVFSANDGSTGKELWATDGTAAGTTLLRDINAITGSYPGGNGHWGITPFGTGKALFSADDGQSTGTGLWVTNGTAAGTYRLVDSTNGVTEYNPSNITVLDGKALFSATDPTNGDELWVTDGTSAGTHRVADIYPGFANAYPSHITPLGNGTAVFQANDGTHSATPNGNELWVTDGTTAGTSLVKDIDPGIDSSDPGGIAVTAGIVALGNGKAVFLANDGTHGTELWATDGTPAGTTLADDINPGAGNSSPYELTALGNGEAVFQADDGVHGTELWVTDGTAAGTSMVADLNAGTGASSPHNMAALGNGQVLFQAFDGTTAQLWVTNGTAGGTMEIVINPNGASSNPSHINAIGGGLALFQADDGTNGAELWVTDGTVAGTSLVDNIYPGADSSNPQGFAVVQPACFCSGTHILTDTGERAVEDLVVGELVVTSDGRSEPIVWLGRRKVDCERHPEPDAVWPVRVSAGAFGLGAPRSDLFLSPDHAVFVNGVLVPVKLLINGTTVTQMPRSSVTYHHVELPRHDVILAEGLPVESYLDIGDRADFDAAGDVVRLFPDFSARLARDVAWVWETHGAARLVMSGTDLDAARDSIAAAPAMSRPLVRSA